MSLIIIKKHKPTSPGIRWKKSILAIKNKIALSRSLFVSQNWSAGRTKSGVISFKNNSSKKLFRKKTPIFATKLIQNLLFFIKTIKFNYNKRKSYCFCETEKSGLFLIPNTSLSAVGRVFLKNDVWQRKNPNNLVGIPVYAQQIPFFTKICNITETPYFKYQYATSSGVFSIKLRASKKEKQIKIKLPSGFFKFIKQTTLVFLGVSNQHWVNKQTIGKAGINVSKGKKPSVRGIAMNSVDHPHGGKANSVKPEKSPWGWVTKHSH